MHDHNIPSHFEGLPADTTEFVMTCNQQTGTNLIDKLTWNSFLHVPKLRHFESRGCPLTFIEDGTFERLVHLRNLTIGMHF